MFEPHEHSDSSDEEEWLYSSIQRYKILHMFEFDFVVKQMEYSDFTSVCIASSKVNGEALIQEFSLPDKLLAAPANEGYVKSCDLKLRRGCFLGKSIVQMKVLYKENRILVSQENDKSVLLLSLDSDSDSISKLQTFITVEEPWMSYNKHNAVLFSNGKDAQVMDIESGHMMPFKVPNVQENEKVKSEFTSENVAALCNTKTGGIIFWDIRSSVAVGNTQMNVCSEKDVWNFTTSFACNLQSCQSDNVCVGLLSSHGCILIYDIRNLKCELCQHNMNSKGLESNYLQFHPDQPSLLSVSGLDENVYIFQTNSTNQLKPIFLHDGHKIGQAKHSLNNTTCHLWFQNDTVLSASENKSLHCWQYVQ